MKVITDIEQGSREWHEARRCKVSGTKLKQVMGTPHNQFDLIAELIAERGTEQTKNFRPTVEMERGTNEEIFALQAFEQMTKKKVSQVGLCISSDFDWLVLSPDGLIKDKKGKYTEAVEVKSPDSSTLIKYKLANLIPQEETKITPAKMPFLGVPADYKWQVINYFIVNPDLQKLHFVTYDERFIDDGSKNYTVIVERDHPVMQEVIDLTFQKLPEFREKWQIWEETVLPNNF